MHNTKLLTTRLCTQMPACIFATQTSTVIRHGSDHTGFRYAKKVYEIGDKIPLLGQKPRIQMEMRHAEDGQTSSAASLFNETMSEISKSTKKTKHIALEGVRLIEDALLAGLRMDKLFLLKSIKEVPDKIRTLMTPDVKIQKVGQKQMELWSSLMAPPGLIGIFPKPTLDEILKWTSNGPKIPVTLICDTVREPGNLGSILRSAAGVGCKKVLLTKGSVDPWDRKVLRGGSGAQFRLPVIPDITMCDTVTAHLDSSFSESIGIFLADSDVQDRTKFGIPAVSYRDVDYGLYDQIYLVMGGETEGISSDTLQTMSKLKASFVSAGTSVTLSRIHIPLHNGVDSLNVANAFGVIAFEIRRQFDCKDGLITDLQNS